MCLCQIVFSVGNSHLVVIHLIYGYYLAVRGQKNLHFFAFILEDLTGWHGEHMWVLCLASFALPAICSSTDRAVKSQQNFEPGW